MRAALIRTACIGTTLGLLLTACTSGGDPHQSADTSAAPSPPSIASATPSTERFPDWPTYHGDAARTGLATSMPAVRGEPRVTKTLRLDGAVYASPLVVRGIVIVATENDSVYAFDLTGRQQWHVRLGSPSPADERPCGNVDPLGITGTPVYDAATGTVFVAPEYGHPVRHELVALDAASGTVRWRRSIDLPGADKVVMQERGALALTGGRVWVPFGGLAGDCGNYKGRVVGVATNGSGAAIGYTVPTTRAAGIWTPPGPSVDAAGHLFVAVGNGDARTGDRYDYSDSILELDDRAQLVDSFSPAGWAADNESDLDLGSQGPALVGTWIFSAGKSGTGYVLRRGRLGGIGGEVSSAPVCRSFGGTAVAGDVVYVPCTDGLRAVRITSAGRMQLLWRAAGNVTGSPVVGGRRVWSIDPHAGVLHMIDPVSGASMGEVRVQPTSRFATPALYGPYVLVPTDSGLVIVRTS